MATSSYSLLGQVPAPSETRHWISHQSREREQSLFDLVHVQALCDLGYSAMDIITTLFRVVRNYQAQEFLKLEYIRVKPRAPG